ncbi:MAG: hypothetical protein ACLFNU_09285 [Bacteroidales bacterium]
MRKRILLLAISLAFVTLASGQPMVSHFLENPSDKSKGRPFKRIEEVSEIIIKGVYAVPHRVVKEFNSHGNILSKISYNSAGGVSNETRWEYVDGVRLKRKESRFFANMLGWISEEVIIDWDEETMQPQKVRVVKNGKPWRTAFISLDTLGKVEGAKVIDSQGGRIFNENFIYLESSNMIKVMVHRANGIFYGSWSYPIDPLKEFEFESVSRQYYPNGEVKIETLSNAAKGDQAYYYEYEYDNQGNWIEKSTYQVKIGRKNKLRRKRLEHKVTRIITYQ